jgi:hypothetical protein
MRGSRLWFPDSQILDEPLTRPALRRTLDHWEPTVAPTAPSPPWRLVGHA